MKRTLSIALLLISASLVQAQQIPEVAKGFNADKAYDFSGVDAINLFNGSVTVTLPLGQTYNVGPNLSYRFTLVYTGNNWQMESNTWYSNDESGYPSVETKSNYYEPFAAARAAGSSDAGLGWQLTLGREKTGLTVGASEAGHAFGKALRPPLNPPDPTFDANADVGYANDGSYLRERRQVVCSPSNPTDKSCYELDYPNGITYKWDAQLRLMEMRDMHPTVVGASAHTVNVTREYDTNGNATAIVVSDSIGRSHRFTFTRMSGVPGVNNAPPPPGDTLGSFTQPEHYDVLSEATIAAFGNTTATYTFSYFDGDTATTTLDAAKISRKYAPIPDCEVPPVAHVPLLAKVTLPDGLSYDLSYDRGDMLTFSEPAPDPALPPSCPVHASFSGNIAKVQLPTRGAIEWQHRTWVFPPGYFGGRCPSATGVPGPCGRGPNTSDGVATRLSRAENGHVVAKRTYSSAMYKDSAYFDAYHTQITTVQDYVGFATDGTAGTVASTDLHYYSIGTEKSEIHGIKVLAGEYGLPFTRFADPDPETARRVANPDSSGPQEGATRFISTKTIDGNGVLKRYTYVGYDADNAKRDDKSNRRVQAESVVHKANLLTDADTYVVTTRSDFDGVGNYRTSKTSSNIPGTPDKVTYTDFVGISTVGGTVTGTYDPLVPTKTWFLSPYRSTSVTEGDRVVRAEFCFNRHLVTRKRLIRDTVTGAPGPDDVIVALTYDSRGNVTNESYRGGDRIVTETGVSSGSLCDLTTLGTLDYEIVHDPVNPGANDWVYTAKHSGMNFFSTDLTVDKNTGLVSASRDTAGVATTFDFDGSGRLKSMKPTGRASTFYTYPTTASRTVTVEQHEGTTVTATPLTRAIYTFDSFGRVEKEASATPGDTTSVRTITYDQLGRRQTASELVAEGTTSPPPVTQFAYDYAGRVTSTTAPDGSVTSHTYTGAAKQARTAKIWTGSDSDAGTTGTQEQAVTVTETYDGYGRLIAVEEASGPTSAATPIGSLVKTEYTYGPSDKLTAVKMNTGANAGTVQHRLFDYDGRGFLRWESQPESGMTSYVYDARGHVLTKSQAGAQSQFDLKYTYDSAERVVKIEGRNPEATSADPAYRTIKEFEYGTATPTATDKSRGKLLKATRYNYLHYDSVYKVTDLYGYKDLAGRMTLRTTTISNEWDEVLKSFDVKASYTVLDAIETMWYPMCEGCGYPAQTPARSDETRTYERGRLTGIGRFTSPGDKITYWPNGVRNVLPHSNGIADTQTVTNMARPASLKFATYDRCVKPTFTVQPGNKTSQAAGASVTLTASVSGSGPFMYDWYSSSGTPVGTTASITVSPSQTTEYYVAVTNACGTTVSQVAVVTVGGCALPTTGTISIISQPDGSLVLTPKPTAKQTRQYQWRQLPSETVIGTQETFTVTSPPSQTTTYKLTIIDDCGQGSSTVTLYAAPAMPSTGLSATVNSTSTQIHVSWPAVSGVSSYELQRRSGADWQTIAEPTSASYTDTNVIGGKTYAYRVSAGGSYGNVDVATTIQFTPVAAGQSVTAADADAMLVAVNKVREAAGWPGVTWTTILSPSDPVVASDKAITARQLLSCRARMNEARQALGAAGFVFTDSNASGAAIKALHINEVHEASR